MRFRVQIESVFPAVDKRYSNTCSPLFPCMKRSRIWGYLATVEMMSPPKRVCLGKDQPTGIPHFLGLHFQKTRSWTHLVPGFPDLHRILCAKNVPQGTPLKRKSPVLLFGGYFRFLVQIKGFFPAVDKLYSIPCSPAFLHQERSPIWGYFPSREIKSSSWQRKDQPTGIPHFFQVSNLKNKVMDASGDRITPGANG